MPIPPRSLRRFAPRPGRSIPTAALAAILLAACSDDLRSPDPTGPDLVIAADTVPVEVPEQGGIPDDDIPTIRRVGLTLQVEGPFEPGRPIRITAVADANLDARDTRVQLLVLHDDTVIGPNAQVRSQRVREWRGNLAPRQREVVLGTVRFDRPGYYEVVALVASEPGRGEQDGRVGPRGETVVLSQSSETLQILVDENGGRVTRGFDSSVVRRDRQPLYGHFGPFVQSAARPSGSRAMLPAAQRSVSAASAAEYVSGRYQYFNHDRQDFDGVPQVLLDVTCYDPTGAAVQQFRTYTDANGNFTFACPYLGYSIRTDLSNRYVTVRPGNAEEGGGPWPELWINDSWGRNPVINAPSNYQADIYRDLQEHIPRAFSWFGRSRPGMFVYVSETDPNFGIHYDTGGDLIRTNYDHIFTSDGLFISLHEYGHAFMWRAIERPDRYSCSDANGDGQPEHWFLEEENLSCAYVEGFANFFAFWIASDKHIGSLRRTEGFVGDMEEGHWAPGRNGVRVEATVAAFLFDIVDSDGSESFDGVSYGGAFVADVMSRCILVYDWAFDEDYLDGADELVYCFEGNVSARGAVPAEFRDWWRTGVDGIKYAGGLTRPQGFDAAAIRRLWRYNFYGLL